MASGGNRRVRGSFEADGNAIDVTAVGFKPAEVILYNTSGDAQATWQDSMPDGSMQKAADDGAATRISLVTGGNGVTPLGKGFRLGADADLNVSGETVHWVATD